jgi:hypothetical protein
MACAELEEDRLGDYRTINSPGLSPSAAEIAEAVRAAGRPRLGRISFRPDPAVEKMVAAWPRYMAAERAEGLGLRADASITEIVRDYAATLD